MLFTKKDKKPNIQEEIDHTIEVMSGLKPDSKEYAAATANLDVLIKAQSCNAACKRISPDTIAVIAGNLIGIVLVLEYEKIGVVTSKAFGMIVKGRV